VAARKTTDLTALTTPTANTLVPAVDLGEALPSNQNKKLQLSDLTKGLSAATTDAAGVVQLSTSTSSTSTSLAATPSAVKSAYDLAAAALPKSGGTMTGVITYASAQPRLVRETAKATTSGTSIDFTGLPTWVKRIQVAYSAVSTNGTSRMLIQVGAGSVETTSYESAISTIGTGVASTTSTAGFIADGPALGAPGQTISGVMTLINISGNLWVASVAGSGGTVGAGTFVGGGTKTLSGTLARLRLTTANGTDTFDAGSVNIIYEG
jgi:hypothetical protein